MDEMSIDPTNFEPGHVEPRGEFPRHGDRIPHEPYTAAEALKRALKRLADWRQGHPHGD